MKAAQEVSFFNIIHVNCSAHQADSHTRLHYAIALIKPICDDVCLQRHNVFLYVSLFHTSPTYALKHTHTLESWDKEGTKVRKTGSTQSVQIQLSAGREAPLVKTSTIFFFFLFKCLAGAAQILSQPISVFISISPSWKRELDLSYL